MKTQKVQLNYLRIAPRKVRLVANVIKNLSVSEAEAQLLLSPQKAAESLIKLLRNAVAAAKNNQQLDSKNLFVKEISVDQVPTLKRYLPRAMCRATPLSKKSSHITLILAESEKLKEPRFKIVKREKITKTQAERLKKEKKEKEIPKPKAEEAAKTTKQPGFIKRMFRRKSI